MVAPSLVTRSTGCGRAPGCRRRPRSRTYSSRCSSRSGRGRARAVLRRELGLVLRARVTWLQAALAALLIGHGFVLALDLYSAGSRSAQAGTLMGREFDPLLGIVR